MSWNVADAGDDLPDLDDRLVEPESRYEMLDGELVYVPPADSPHGDLHAQLCALIEIHARPGFRVSCDLLTRTSRIDDIAPDVSIYPAGPDPTTGRRQLQTLVFEVVSTQSLRNAARKAAKFAARGVRRVFAIDVERERALEWSATLGAWRVLDAAGVITDPVLAVPLPIASLIRFAIVDDAIARALVAKRNPVIEAALAAGKATGLAEGKATGLAEAVIAVLAARGLAVDAAARVRILSERDQARLARWIALASSCASAADLLAAP